MLLEATLSQKMLPSCWKEFSRLQRNDEAIWQRDFCLVGYWRIYISLVMSASEILHDRMDCCVIILDAAKRLELSDPGPQRTRASGAGSVMAEHSRIECRIGF
jgi:hypothetical protein